MSMLIIGVNPPKSCYACSWYNKVECPVKDGRYYYRVQRHPSCPLTEIKEPHGSLVDFDQMVEDYWDGALMVIDERKFKQIESSIIIEAEGSDMNEN